MKGSNPLNDIAANLGVTPKVLTQLATGEDREFRELVRGILSMLPEPEILMVASDPEIPPEFLEYLRRLFDNNRKILFAILQNPAGQRQTKRAVLEKLPENTLMALLQNPATPADIREILTQARSKGQGGAMPNAPSQAEEFKIKMKVSKLLNDLEANLGVSIEAFMAIRGRDDEQSKEFVREVYNALPEENVIIVARDSTTTTKILDYLSQLFDTNQKVLYTILHNPIANEKTKRFILSRLPQNAAMMAAKNPKTPPDLLAFLAEYFVKSDEMLALLLMNPSTPTAVKEKIEEQSSSEESGGDEETLDLEEFPSDFTPQASAPSNNDVEAKITLCVDKLYDINADIVTEFIKQARTEILKRLELIARANRLILRTIMRTPSLSIQDIEHINMDLFVTLLKKLPDDVDDKTILQLMMQSKIGK